MTIGGELIWDWLKKAPLPVVLAISLSSSAALGAWLNAVDNEVAAQQTTVAVAAVQSKAAADQAKAAADTTKRVEEKVDKLLEIVLKNEAEKAAAEKAEKAAADKAAKKKEPK